jgi:hypothetical protein
VDCPQCNLMNNALSSASFPFLPSLLHILTGAFLVPLVNNPYPAPPLRSAFGETQPVIRKYGLHTPKHVS